MKKITNKQKALDAILWIDRLATTKAKQQDGRLGDSEKGYCCLGYGCQVLDVPFESEDSYSEEFQQRIGLLSSFGSFHVPHDNPKGRIMKNINVPIVEDGDRDEQSISSLADLNDDTKYSFRKISTIIKKYPEKLFEPKVASKIKKHYS